MAGYFVKANSEYVLQVSNVANLRIENGTMTFWVKLSSALAGSAVYIMNYANDGLGFLIAGNSGAGHADETLTWKGDGGNLRMLYKNGEDYLFDDAIHHIVIICDGNDNRYLIDGAAVAETFDAGDSGTNDGLIDNAINNFLIGSDNAGNGFTGSIWDYRIYNRGITDAEAKIIYEERGKDNITNGLVIRLPMFEGPTGSTMTVNTDVGPNGYNGSPQNTPTYTDQPFKM